MGALGATPAPTHVLMAEQGYAPGPGPGAARREGSTPSQHTSMRRWRNRDTRQVEGLVPQGVWVRLPLGALRPRGEMEDAAHSNRAAHHGVRVRLPPRPLARNLGALAEPGRRGRLKPGWLNRASSTLACPACGPIVSIGKTALSKSVVPGSSPGRPAPTRPSLKGRAVAF